MGKLLSSLVLGFVSGLALAQQPPQPVRITACSLSTADRDQSTSVMVIDGGSCNGSRIPRKRSCLMHVNCRFSNGGTRSAVVACELGLGDTDCRTVNPTTCASQADFDERADDNVIVYNLNRFERMLQANDPRVVADAPRPKGEPHSKGSPMTSMRPHDGK